MKRIFPLLLWLGVLYCPGIKAQELNLEDIMKGYQWVGHSPKNVFWSVDSKTLFFHWNPDNNESDSLYQYSIDNKTVTKTSWDKRRVLYQSSPVLNRKKTKAVYIRHGDVFLIDVASHKITRVTNTLESVSDPYFSFEGDKILFTQNNNLFSWGVQNGRIIQLTQFLSGEKPQEKAKSASDLWLENDQKRLFKVLNDRIRKDSLQKARIERLKPSRPLPIYLGKQQVSQLKLSPDERFITYRLRMPLEVPQTKVMNYVTESGYAQTLNARAKVGHVASDYKFGIYDVVKDTAYHLNTSDLQGIHDLIDFSTGERTHDPESTRAVLVDGPLYSDDGGKALVQIRTIDNKDRWICLLDLPSGNIEMLDRQTDPAWIQGPGIGYLFNSPSMGWLPDNESIWFQSEASGYSHLYTLNVRTKKSTALTMGAFEVYNPRLSLDKSSWYFSSNEAHPGERHFYKMKINGGRRIQITSSPGRNDVFLSPDERKIAVLNSTATQPWELYAGPNTQASPLSRITNSQSDDFAAYPWRTPEYILFPAQDGAQVPARLYKPTTETFNGAGVIFVHGAGYLQNAHKWWSSYYREYMFHNFLTDRGYTVLDVDYRGSAGYGRDWRTGIYQFMGGKDLSDQIDGAHYLVEQHQLDPQRLGIYGGSYGGFITLMAMFTKPEVFAAGAALRSVTDWAHYNHPYTSNILNQPKQDSLAFVKSSPIYHAEGLQGALLMLHGMVDRNVQFQDVVRLSQRLIELKKENWELAVYPMEGHGFKEPSSWYDEYRRIYTLFETHLNKP